MVHLSVSVICVVDVYSKLPAPAILWYQYHHSDCQLSAAESLWSLLLISGVDCLLTSLWLIHCYLLVTVEMLFFQQSYVDLIYWWSTLLSQRSLYWLCHLAYFKHIFDVIGGLFDYLWLLICEFVDVLVRSFHCLLVTFLKTLMITVSSPFLLANIYPASLQTVSSAVGIHKNFLSIDWCYLLIISWFCLPFISYCLLPFGALRYSGLRLYFQQ